MKKSLILLCALAAAVATAETETLNTFTFTTTSGTEVTVNGANEQSSLTLGDLVLNGDKSANTTAVGNGDYFYKSTNTPMQAMLTPNVNVGYASKSWTLDFTFTNNSGATMYVNALELTMRGMTGGGGQQNNGSGVPMPAGESWVGGTATGNKPVDVTISWGESKSASLTYNMAMTNWSDTHTGTFSLGETLALADGESLTFSLNVANNSAYTSGTFAGVTSMALTIPEPTTATLSLLALAGLAARRRRK